MSSSNFRSSRSALRCVRGTCLMLGMVALLQLGGCAVDTVAALNAAQAPVEITNTPKVDEDKPKVLFVLLDGTRNDPASSTNIYLMKEAIEASSLPAKVLYVEGVGAAKDSLVLGPALGVGMEARINQGYRFLSEHHRPGDRIVIMGFSRGAHQARALAGLVAYAGLVNISSKDAVVQIRMANRVIEAVKGFTDEETDREMRSSPEEPPKMAMLSRSLNLGMRPARVDFLGVWDTVPGSSFKEYGECKELPDRRTGDRYKTGSYPGISWISHAVALDEKRSMFRPILLCPAIIPDRTKVHEAWFSGAHADVGGGYGKADHSLSRVSLAWMADELSQAIGIKLKVPAPTQNDMLAIAHWSMGDAPANFRSHCADRTVPKEAVLHESVDVRRRVALNSLNVQGKSRDIQYPFTCKQVGEAQQGWTTTTVSDVSTTTGKP